MLRVSFHLDWNGYKKTGGWELVIGKPTVNQMGFGTANDVGQVPSSFTDSL